MAAVEPVSSHITQSVDNGPIFHFPDIDQPHSPGSTVSQDSDSDERYSFTPKQLPRGPRAWQRQPSQPFAPRNDAQKIWKRAPLKNITSEINTKWKRGADEDDGVVRPAKRLKLQQMHADGKENEEVGVVPAYLPTPWDPDPAREAAKHALVEDGEPEMQDEILDTEVSEPETTDVADGFSEAGHVAGHETEQVPSDVSVDDITADTDDVDKPGQLPLDDEQTSAGDDSTGAELGPEMCFDVTPAIATGDGASADTDPGTAAKDGIVAELDPSKDEATQITELLDTAPRLPFEAYVSASDKALVSPAKQSVNDADQNNETFVSVAAPPSSRPLVQPEEDDTAFLQQFLQRAKQAREKNPSLQLYRPVGDRVKRHLIEQHNQASPQANERKRPLSPEPDDLSQIDSPEDATVTTTVLIPSVEEVTEKPPSPSRRSNRLTATTKLPRPQRPTALPSNISLRRLNGTEFISMAKQRTEAQNVAMTTRTNTRKNKGSALSVQQRLEEIKLGFVEAGDLASTAGVPDRIDERAKKVKLRKKTGVEYDHISWAHKIARYQKDGEEHTLTLDGMWETNAVSQPSKVEQDDEVSESKQSPDAELEAPETKADPESKRGDSRKPANSSVSTPKKATRSSSSSSSKSKSKLKAPANKTDAVEASNSSGHKSETTKRKRAETIGTVNGTPAPNRGLDLMLESARDNEGVTIALGLGGRETDAETKGHETTGAETRGSKRLKAKKSAAAK